MTTELLYLTLSAILAASLRVPFIAGVNAEDQDLTDFTRPPALTDMRPRVHRAFRAHQSKRCVWVTRVSGLRWFEVPGQ
ncbi:hypothetical protein [Actibacterium sp. 188UL27-1]|uniref:hypothetical protein n=1 Tax=Actibacterium sp. 188UL27-1 TaxID=2786961 RepID=UPI00195D9782|nr:hypothetical protein [Actibacterium sp. 188UL27-1]MBM7068666.1 hypothetical protein [Actibacterium sp. 188UL27-1]